MAPGPLAIPQTAMNSSAILFTTHQLRKHTLRKEKDFSKQYRKGNQAQEWATENGSVGCLV